MQWMHWNSGIWWWGHCLWCKNSNQWMQWTQYAVNAVCSEHSGIVVYGGGHIVFGVKRSNQWTQFTVDAVNSGRSTYTVDTVDAVDAVV